MYGSGIEQPTVDFSTLDYLQITPGSYFIGFDSGNLGKLSKIDSAGNITVLENSSISFQYEIGQHVASEGGVIANRWLSNSAGGSPTSGTIQNYLVVDTIDLATGTEWATSNVDIPNVESTWNGKANTIVLINAGVAGGITTGTAAQLCDASTNNDKNDWYLPAIDELYKVWNNRWEIAQGLEIANGSQLIFSGYWSSTEYVFDYAWYFNFYNGNANAIDKNNTFYVRAVRQFSI
jgi:hypothetical protein